ncbi:MAG: Uma2 family endonuclease [Leptospiraceae bacterium]|nr:Uma2 family endonuclease [Leptospiraceae bacterium]
MQGSILEIPEFRTRIKRFSIEEYHSLGAKGEIGENVELIQGYIIQKIPKSPLHTQIVNYLFRVFLPLESRGFLVHKEDPITIHDSEPEPDISIVEKISIDKNSEHPKTARLVIEVAVTSYELDLSKLEVYASALIPEVWIIVPTRKEIEVYSNILDNHYITKKILSLDESIQFEGISLDIKSIFS